VAGGYKKMNILITAGGTHEKIDKVRSITNTSTGQTAHSIANFLYENDYKNIYYVHSTRSKSFGRAKENISFVSSDDLEKALKYILRDTHIDVIIHAAAVSDFIVDKVVINGELFEAESINKISSQDEVELVLKKRSKIIDSLKTFAQKSSPLVIGFKLTNTKEPEDQMEQVLKLSMNENVDFVVHNDLHDIDKDMHKAQIYFKDSLVFAGKTKEDLNKNLLELLKTYTFNLEAYRNGSKHDLMS
jgi:phosphopantothenoylcysteine synthetase/decarboxylase